MTVATMEWSTEFAIGHANTDAQHQQLFKLLGLIRKASESDADREDLIEKSLNALIEYTQVHFRDEEALMEQIQFPGFSEHRELHDNLIHEVENMLDELQDGEYLLIDELMLFLTDWLSEHILTQDAEIGNYIREQGLSA